jgi:coenzyme PQQ synthesis protein D (PqqD)
LEAEQIKINAEKVVHEMVDGEVLIINLENGSYYQLVDAAVQAWRGIERGATEEELNALLRSRYLAEPEEINSGLAEFLSELKDEEIIVREQSSNHGEPEPGLEETSGKTPFTGLKLTKYTNMSDLLLLDPIHDVDEQGWPNRKPE